MTSDPYRRRVKDVLSKEVVAVQTDDSLQDALTLMQENRVSALPVVNGKGSCIGIISISDLVDMTREMGELLRGMDHLDVPSQELLDRLSENDLARQTVGDAMTESVASIGPDAPLQDAAREMLRHKVHRLPVVNHKDNHLLGLVSTMDILVAFVDGSPG